jgi:hypothetical protein
VLRVHAYRFNMTAGVVVGLLAIATFIDFDIVTFRFFYYFNDFVTVIVTHYFSLAFASSLAI